MTTVTNSLGKVEVINETQLESLQTIKEMFAELGVQAPSDRELISDWGIKGGETNAQLNEWAKDYASEIHTEKCAARSQWRYEN